MTPIPTNTYRPITYPGLRAFTLIATALLAGCSDNAELAETKRKLDAANSRIAVLEAAAAKGTPATIAAPVPVATAPAVADAGRPAAPEPEIGKQWHYASREDAMTGKTQFSAMVASSNTVDFGFPYNGEQHGRLTLRIHPQHGKDVIFRLDKGQILCPSYEGCQVQARFDDGKPVRFAATGAADHSTEMVFIDDYAGFVSRLKKAKRVRLAIEVYQNGRPAFDFDVSGFDTAQYQPKS